MDLKPPQEKIHKTFPTGEPVRKIMWLFSCGPHISSEGVRRMNVGFGRPQRAICLLSVVNVL